MDISSIPSYVPKAAIVGFVIVLGIIIAEIYVSISRKRKKDAGKREDNTNRKKRPEPELKPLKFPEVPKQPSPLITKKTALIAGSAVFLIAGGGVGVYLASTSGNASTIASSNATQPRSISIVTPSATPPEVDALPAEEPTATPLPTETPVPEASQLLYFTVTDTDEWNPLAPEEVLAQPPESLVHIAVHYEESHSGIRMTVDGTDYLSAPEDITPDGDFFIILPRSAIPDNLLITATPLP